ncbi:ABC transporter ATP-binding protein [Phreatobacter sp. AB_2022a]|uniref:ABC transporter ATP-binding protein n=1 Tax=Phreatobacter sp. AB_2022a TaxID=3003134 RepID=UPI0022870A67|nr:oligopeptide/dipeptide ABC transporter ATP-binding protein [Phreatobacter sp. AB_2022a]MCZ0733118.1 ATP-binding cassette domain-containing protein [Phreatobacter sp. AB_2022a]
MTRLLDVENLSRSFEVRLGGGLMRRSATLKAVDGVSFGLDAGRTLGIVGESGCGKSTTAKLVLGMIPASGGRISFAGEPVTARHDAGWRAQRAKMQMIYQDPLAALDRRLTLAQQIAEPMIIHGLAATRAERQDRVGALMAAVGLRPDMATRYPHEISGGQRQRAVIARALALEPKLIVCDEPVSALDVSIAAQVVNLFQDLQERLGVGYLFISHDLKVVRQVSHEVAVMYLGRIVERGAPDALFHRPAHPYTRALVAAVPSVHRRRQRERIILAGDPPSPVDVPRGCAFHPRCPLATGACREVTPILKPGDDGRLVACHAVHDDLKAAA